MAWARVFQVPLAVLVAPGLFPVMAAFSGPLLVVQRAAFGYFWLQREFLDVPILPPVAGPPDED